MALGLLGKDGVVMLIGMGIGALGTTFTASILIVGPEIVSNLLYNS